jgi:hypothetical protein
MQGTDPFYLPLSEYPPVLPYDTDTATPRSKIPIYPIHSLQQPYCRDENCACRRRQKEVAKLLGLITEGIMTLREAADFVEGEENG